MREWAVNGVLVITVMGGTRDGAIALIDLRGGPGMAEALDKALP